MPDCKAILNGFRSPAHEPRHHLATNSIRWHLQGGDFDAPGSQCGRYGSAADVDVLFANEFSGLGQVQLEERSEVLIGSNRSGFTTPIHHVLPAFGMLQGFGFGSMRTWGRCDRPEGAWVPGPRLCMRCAASPDGRLLSVLSEG